MSEDVPKYVISKTHSKTFDQEVDEVQEQLSGLTERALLKHIATLTVKLKKLQEEMPVRQRRDGYTPPPVFGPGSFKC